MRMIFLTQRQLKTAFIYILLGWICSIQSFSQDLVPYLQTPTDTSIWISWKTNSLAETSVQFGTDSLLLNQTVAGGYVQLEDPEYIGDYIYHSVHLKNLQPSASYYYKAISGSKESKIYRFKTQPANGQKDKHYRFLIFGDHQVADRDGYERLMQAAKDKVFQKYGGSIDDNINLIINDGDQVDQGTLWQYENVHFNKSQILSPVLPIMTVIGNHETYGSLGLDAYYPHFFYDSISYKGIKSPSGENYYSFQSGRVVFVMTSTEHPEQKQIDWVQQIVDSVKVDNKVDWLFSVGHRPIQAEQYVGDISVFARDEIIPVLTQTEKSALFISGHHHLYARGQLRDSPLYHIISGAASWDQYWGQSTEIDFDDVQKTIDYWTYQIVDIDLENKKMDVECYAIGSPKLGFTLDNILIDSFHRQFGKSAPLKPDIITIIADTIQLPFTFESSEYQTDSDEEFNSTQFQFSQNEDFTNPEVDIIRDFENLYGTSGDPAYLPIDIHENLNLFEYNFKQYQLPNGKYFVRGRHRDKNTEWSEWSDSKSFVVSGSTEGVPEVSTEKTYFDPDETIKINYKYGPNNHKDWIGIYKKGDVPGGGQSSTDWKYVNASSGSINLKAAEGGEYFIVFFTDDGYTEISERISVYVTSVPVTKVSKPGFDTGEQIVVNYSNAPSFSNDWIGLYKINDIPGNIGSIDWEYVSGQTGSVTFSSLPKGYYFANYFLLNAYDEPGNRDYFTVGNNLAGITTDKEIYSPSENILVALQNGPGLQNDWIGIFKADEEILIDSIMVMGSESGVFTYSEELDAESYFLSFFMNGSNNEISNRKYFKVESDVVSSLMSTRNKTISIYPSPTDGIVNIDFNNFNEIISEISVTTLSGKLALFQDYEKNQVLKSETINLSGNKKGIYIIRIITDKSSITRKIILH